MWSARKRPPDPPRPSERLRIPQPLIRTRLPSGRGATEQPNVTSDGDTALTPVFWMVLAATGVAAGLFGDLMMFLLFSVEHLAFGFNAGPLQDGVRHASDLRRLIVLPLGGLIGGVAWYLLRRYTDGKSEIDDSIWNGDGKLSFRRSFGTSVISEVVIGMGASLGREAGTQADGRGVRERAGHLGPAVDRAAAAAGRVRRRGRPGRGLQRPAGRGAVHGRGDGWHAGPAGGAARAGLFGYRHRGGLDLPARARHLPEYPRLPVHAAAAGLGAAGGPGDRGHRRRVHPADRLGVVLPVHRLAFDPGHGRGVRDSGPDRLRAAATVRQRPGPGQPGLPRPRRVQPAAAPVPAQTAGHRACAWAAGHPAAC